MQTVGLNHFNITAPRALLERVKDFYVEVLGLEVGARPNFMRDGFWLYAGHLPIVHLTICDESEERADSLTSFVDHIAFTCKGLSGFVERLERLRIPFRVADGPTQVQVFIRDPAGVGVELNFTQEASLEHS
ncbi:MAG TPA: VOC family protein [Pyrinomonadaceae bacterium]|jgi:catechol 2,3-dioxygenase-like lactoylglutathione lyase family enzyme